MAKIEQKGIVEKRIRNKYQREFEARVSRLTKLRFPGQVKACYSYMKNAFNDQFKIAIGIRLNMTGMVLQNYRGRGTYILCGKEDRIEHIAKRNAVFNHGYIYYILEIKQNI